MISGLAQLPKLIVSLACVAIAGHIVVIVCASIVERKMVANVARRIVDRYILKQSFVNKEYVCWHDPF